MLTAWERLKVALLVRLTWRLSRARMLASLRLFAATEADSAWQLAYAVERTPDPARRADLFGQILEEQHHAAEFARLVRELGGGPDATSRYERRPLYPAADDVWKFYAYCQVGEAAAATRFQNIHRVVREPAVRAVLRRILRDEAKHVHGATELLAGMEHVSRRSRARELRRIRRRRLREAWLRSGRQITDLAATLILSMIYVAVGPWGMGPARRRFVRRARDTQAGTTEENREPVYARPLVRIP